MSTTDIKMPSVVYKIEDKCYSIPSKYVESIIKMDTITKLPNEPAHVKGIVKYRDRIYKVIDLRKVFGFSALEDKINAFDDLLKARKQDHINWLNELENSVKEKRDFKLATDPTKCAFGKWYYNFKTDDISLKEHLDKF
jgi:chemotaxis protein histidine kinase CheA